MPGPATKYGLVLFPGFQALDVFGPIDVLNSLARPNGAPGSEISLAIIAATLDPVCTTLSPSFSGPSGSFYQTAVDTISGMGQSILNIGQSIVPTHTFESFLEEVEAGKREVDVLLVPGGFGTRVLAIADPVVDFVGKIFPHVRYLLTVCTGSALVARTGILDGRRATGNKRSWEWVIKQGPKVQWVSKARWVVDGNIWTSSGISAGIDMFYAFVADQYGEETAALIAHASEYVRNMDADDDPFAR
ncbi:class I glutamine amidotransferase-like protein [Xylariaceae sp. FL0255]|nr:class I glutamine amidotransferase-like protein [Xylariaceae sp. FL0255]